MGCSREDYSTNKQDQENMHKSAARWSESGIYLMLRDGQRLGGGWTLWFRLAKGCVGAGGG